MRRRVVFLSIVCALTAAAGTLLAMSRAPYEVSFESVVEIWADLVRDVDRVGLSMTRISPEREMEVGREIEREAALHWRLTADPELQAYVAAVGHGLVGHTQRQQMRYRFHLVSSSAINAFALPGGGIYITTGMLGFLDSEAELAAVLGHEVSHVDLRHAVDRLQYELALRKIGGREMAAIARVGYALVRLGFSEQQELEADAGGTVLAAKAGYDPAAGAATFVRLERLQGRGREEPARPAGMAQEAAVAMSKALEQYFATHPPAEVRVRRLEDVEALNRAAWRGQRFYVGRSNYQDRVPRSRSERPGEWKNPAS